MNYYLSKLSPQIFLQYLMFALVTYFLGIQAWNQSPTTDTAIIIWLVGLISWVIKCETGVTDGQKNIILASCLVFLTCLLSWFFSDYELTFKKIEPDTRFLFFGLTVIAVTSSKLSINQLFIALIIAGISYGCSALYERHSLGLDRVDGDENAVTFGNGAFLIASCLMSVYLTKAHTVLKIIAPLAIIFALIASIYSGTRSSFLALIPLALIAIYKLNNKGRVTSLILVLASAYTVVNHTNFPDRFEQAKHNTQAYFREDNLYNSTGIRLEMWRATLCIWKNNPILGVGPRAFRNANNDELLDCNYPEVKHFNQAHSIIFNTLATKGSLGLISLILFFSALVYFPFKERSAVRFLLLASVVTMLSYGLTVDLLFKVFMTDKHLILLAIIIGLSRKDS